MCYAQESGIIRIKYGCAVGFHPPHGKFKTRPGQNPEKEDPASQNTKGMSPEVFDIKWITQLTNGRTKPCIGNIPCCTAVVLRRPGDNHAMQDLGKVTTRTVEENEMCAADEVLRSARERDAVH